jgi:chemotaxis protein MotB
MSRKKDSSHVNHERWLVSYADFITLLFAFFVVLYSSSQVDKRRVGQLALAIQVAFQQMGIFEASNTKVPVATSEPMPFAAVQMVENVDRLSSVAQDVNSPHGTLAESGKREDLNRIQSELQKVLGPEINKREVALTRTREGLVVSLREVGFFDSGSSEVRSDALPTLDRLISVIAPHDLHVRIEGHTDNVPIHTERFNSNWELSTARAIEMIRLFIMRYQVAPERLSASGYAEYHPAASNDTPEGRAKNRRVDIVILNPPSTLPLPSIVPPPPGTADLNDGPNAAPDSPSQDRAH